MKRTKSNRPTMRRVYLVAEEGDSAYVKIGIADNVAKRLAGLQTGNRRRLVVLETFPGTEALERALHTWFESQRVQGEWFHFPDNDAVYQVTCVMKLGTAFAEMMRTPVQVAGPSNRTRVAVYVEDNPGASHRQIAKATGVPTGSVGRLLRQLNK